jgi:hypothetical protein
MQYLTVQDIEFAIYDANGILYADAVDSLIRFTAVIGDMVIAYKPENTLKFIGDYTKLVFTCDNMPVVMAHPEVVLYNSVTQKLIELFNAESSLEKALTYADDIGKATDKMESKSLLSNLDQGELIQSRIDDARTAARSQKIEALRSSSMSVKSGRSFKNK